MTLGMVILLFGALLLVSAQLSTNVMVWHVPSTCYLFSNYNHTILCSLQLGLSIYHFGIDTRQKRSGKARNRNSLAEMVK